MNTHPTWLGSLGSLALIASIVSFVQCAPVEIVVADVPPTPDSGIPIQHSEPCSTSDDCPAGDYCEKENCSATLGKCKRRPSICDSNADAVCGCNGVTYWNDCLRKLSGIAAKTDGECTEGKECTSTTACSDPAASCALLVYEPKDCPRVSNGRCWVLPLECPTKATAGGSWRTCGPPPACGGLCEAIRAEIPYVRLAEPECPANPPGPRN